MPANSLRPVIDASDASQRVFLETRLDAIDRLAGWLPAKELRRSNIPTTLAAARTAAHDASQFAAALRDLDHDVRGLVSSAVKTQLKLQVHSLECWFYGFAPAGQHPARPA